MSEPENCPLCQLAPISLLWSDAYCSVIPAQIPGIGDFCRVVWRAHVREMTDLVEADRHRLLDVVMGVEEVLRDLLKPAKMNVASLGNLVPHLHWHVIPRFQDDPFFPDSVWAAERRPPGVRQALPEDVLRAALEKRLSGVTKTPL